MRIVLFYPRGYDNTQNKYTVFGLASPLPPIGLASIAAVLRNAGHTVTILDALNHYHIPNSIWIRKILDLQPDFVGFSTTTSSFTDAYSICLDRKSVV